MYRRMERHVSMAQGRYDAASLPLMSGQKHTRPSEDTAWTLEVRGIEREKARIDQHRGAIERVDTFLGSAETNIQNAVSLLQEMSARAVQMRNDSYSATDRANAAKEVASALSELKALANGKVGDRFLFAGRREDQPPFDDLGNYVGDPAGRTVDVADGVTIEADIPGEQVFGTAGAANSAFDALAKLQMALEANDEASLDDAITALNASTKHATGAWSRLGGVRHTLANLASLHADAAIAAESRLAKVGHSDLAEAATRLKAAEDAFSASLATAQRISDLLSKQLQF